jgi:hypothetical protein
MCGVSEDICGAVPLKLMVCARVNVVYAATGSVSEQGFRKYLKLILKPRLCK